MNKRTSCAVLLAAVDLSITDQGLAIQRERYEAGEKHLGYGTLCKELTTMRQTDETAWLSEAPTHPLQQALRDLDRAYQNFFEKRAERPVFKKRGHHDGFRYPDPKQILHVFSAAIRKTPI